MFSTCCAQGELQLGMKKHNCQVLLEHLWYKTLGMSPERRWTWSTAEIGMAQSIKRQKHISPFTFQLMSRWNKVKFYPNFIPTLHFISLSRPSPHAQPAHTDHRSQPMVTVCDILILEQLVYNYCQDRWKIFLKNHQKSWLHCTEKCILYRPSAQVHIIVRKNKSSFP